MIDKQLEAKIGRAGIIAVITIDDPAHAVPLANALLEGGVTAIELTLRTPQALTAIENVARDAPGMTVGAGTVLTKEQLGQVKAAGAAFAVAPGFNPDIVTAAREIELPFAPGVMTPSEIECAWSMGCSVLKYYHAGVAGGLASFKSMVTPYAHLGLRFIPLGGISHDNFGEWMREKSILAVGGSWIAPRDEIAAGAWTEITGRARAAVSALPAAE